MTQPINSVSDIKGLTRNPLEINVAVKEGRTWKNASLGPVETLTLQAVIDTISSNKAVFGKIFKQEGAEVKLTKKGIYTKGEGKKWKDLLSAKGVDKKTRQRIQKTLSDVVSVMSERSQKNGQLQDVQSGDLFEGIELQDDNIVIEVRVRRFEEIFEEFLKAENKTFLEITNVPQVLAEKGRGIKGTERKYLKENSGEIQASLEKLAVASEKVLKIMTEVHNALKDGVIRTAIQPYTEQMPEAYQAYCEAMQEWKKWENAFADHNVKFNGADHILDKSIYTQVEVAKELFGYAAQTSPSQVSTDAALQKIVSSQRKYESDTKIEKEVRAYHALSLQREQEVKKFVGLYENRREKFDVQMRKYGLSDLESAFLFNWYHSFGQLLEQWNLDFQNIIDLAHHKDYKTMLDTYLDLIEDHGPEFAVVHRGEFNRQEIQDIFNKLAVSLDSDSAQLSQMLSIKHLATDMKRGFEKIVRATRDVHHQQSLAFEFPDDHIQSVREILQELEEINTGGEFPSIYLEEIYNACLISAELGAILKNSDWTIEEFKEFLDLCQQYEQTAWSLQKAEQAIVNESNRQKKQALQQQQKELAARSMAREEKIMKELEQRNDFEKLSSFIDKLEQNLGVENTLFQYLKEQADLFIDLFNENGSYVHELNEKLGLA